MRVAVALSMIMSILSLTGVCFLVYQHNEICNNRCCVCTLKKEGKQALEKGKKVVKKVTKKIKNLAEN